MNLTDVLKKPMITEKALNQSVLGKYIFAVDKRATKEMISQAVHQAFGVEVVAVRTINLGGLVEEESQSSCLIGRKRLFSWRLVKKLMFLRCPERQKKNQLKVKSPPPPPPKAGLRRGRRKRNDFC
jgi:ribosomal protein L23